MEKENIKEEITQSSENVNEQPIIPQNKKPIKIIVSVIILLEIIVLIIFAFTKYRTYIPSSINEKRQNIIRFFSGLKASPSNQQKVARKIVATPTPEILPNFSEEELKNHILFARGNNLWSSDITGKNQKEILTNIELSGPVKSDIRISPDFQKILYFIGDDLYLAKPDGSNSEIIKKNATKIGKNLIKDPSIPSEIKIYPTIVWSSDSEAFLYIYSPEYEQGMNYYVAVTYEIYERDLKTKQERFIAKINNHYFYIHGWNRKENEIYAFTIGIMDIPTSIKGYVIDSLNGNIKNEYKLSGTSAKLSPKLDKFILSDYDDKEIFTGTPQKLTIRNIKTGTILKTIEIKEWPEEWSPDGKKILLTGGNILDIESGEITKIPGFKIEGDNCNPVAWSPDSNYIAYTSRPGVVGSSGDVSVKVEGYNATLNIIKTDGSYKKEIIRESHSDCDRLDLGWTIY